MLTDIFLHIKQITKTFYYKEFVVKNLSIPRIELLSCLLLSKLVTSVRDSLESEVYICRTFCWSDSQVTLWWIKQVSKVWKVWISNRVCMIRENVPVECWKFVSGGDNPSDLATRTNTSLANLCGEIWFHGPSFLQLPESEWPTFDKIVENSRDIAFNEEGGDINVLLNSVSLEEGIGKVITIEKFSCLKKLLRVTGYVLRFVRNLRRCLDGKEKVIGELVPEDLEETERLWLIHEQVFIVNDSSFEKRKVSLNLFYDEFNLLRSKTKMNNVHDIHFRKSERVLLRK